jgi:ketosteroid isomerase-like protein
MDNVSIIRSGYDAFAKGDMAKLMEIFDPGIEWTIPDTVGFDSHYSGIDAVMGFFGEIPKLWAELHVEPEEYFALGDDRVLALGTHHGRVVNGESLSAPFAHVWTLREGRATRFFEYVDAGRILRAQGLIREATTV